MFFFAVLLVAAGCSKQNPITQDTTGSTKSSDVQNSTSADTKIQDENSEESEYNELTNEEKNHYDKIKKAIENNMPYEILFSTNVSQEGKIKYDFNNDGKIDNLKYSTVVGSGGVVEKCKIDLAGILLEQNRNGEGISSLGIIDVNNKDNYIEIFINDGYLRGGAATIYRLTDNDIKEIGHLDAGIQATSGDGKIYYWGSNLFERDNNGKFDTDLVLSYYDVDKKEYIETDQIVGKTIVADREISVYKTREDVIGDMPLTDEEIQERSKGKIVKKIKSNEKFEVLSREQGTKVRTEDGKVGWIGGFHMVWD